MIGTCLIILTIVQLGSKLFCHRKLIKSNGHNGPNTESLNSIELGQMKSSSRSSNEISFLSVPVTEEKWKPGFYLRKHKKLVISGIVGFICGVTTVLANIAGPIITAHFLALELPKRGVEALLQKCVLYIECYYIADPL